MVVAVAAEKKPATSEAPPAGGLSVAAHPRAARRVAQARELGGLFGFLLGGYRALPTHTLVGATLLALALGAACYVVVWAAAVLLSRHLILAELHTAQQQLLSTELAKREGSAPRLPGRRESLRAGSRTGR
ncbi:MAG TPA: hypothetical protein VGX16_07625 [Solirubrobacteraceae bacterium]|nr:hypothetical protein [Solirubrobacteraceae bacterium]